MVEVNITIVNTTIGQKGPESGYDIKVYGLDNGQFYSIHIPALTCIFFSLFSAIAVIVASFHFQGFKTFFSWTKTERLVVYLALCDALFNIAHSLDHLHVTITRDHVYPKQLCEFYGFILAVFVSSQMLLVNIVAINAFILMYFNIYDVEFGSYDWKLLLWTFGTPFVGALISALLDKLGPNGAYCYFDVVKGEIANIFFTTVPVVLILTINVVLYTLTWYRIYTEGKRIKDALGDQAKTALASHRVARTMSLFVMALFVQWWPGALFGVWQLVDYVSIPLALIQLVTVFSNVGGILNGIVYIIIRRRRMKEENARRRKSTPKAISLNSNKAKAMNGTEVDAGRRSSVDAVVDVNDIATKL